MSKAYSSGETGRVKNYKKNTFGWGRTRLSKEQYREKKQRSTRAGSKKKVDVTELGRHGVQNALKAGFTYPPEQTVR